MAEISYPEYITVPEKASLKLAPPLAAKQSLYIFLQFINRRMTMLIVKNLSPSLELDREAAAELRRGLSPVKKNISCRWARGNGVSNEAASSNYFDNTAEDHVELNDS